MSRNKKILISCLVCCLALIFGFGWLFLSEQKSPTIFRFTLFRNHSFGETYLFELNEAGVLSVIRGTRRRDEDIRRSRFIRRTQASYEILLDTADFNALIELANMLEQSGFDRPRRDVEGGSGAIFYYNGIVYETILSGVDEELKIFNMLIDKILQLLPQQITLMGF